MNKKYWKHTDGTARWKYNSPFENWLSKRADNSEFMKKLYVGFYKTFDSEFYKNGMKFVDREIDNFINNGNQLPFERKKIVRDMVYSLHRFGIMFNEYFLFEFYQKNAVGRDEYIGDKERFDFYRMMNKDENLNIFNNKSKTYELFKEYYGREMLMVDSQEGKDKFLEFVRKHQRVIVKPRDSTGGKGIFIIDADNDELDQKFADTINNGSFVVEPLIVQSATMAKFHPSSLNTVRFPRIIAGGKVHPFAVTMRMGIGGTIVDNAFAGGCFATVDEKTGIIIASACDKTGKRYIVHPDSGETIIGFQLPEWDKAVELVTKLARTVSSNRYTAWDLAHTDNGWVMVEGTQEVS